MEINEFIFSDDTRVTHDTTWSLEAFKVVHIHPQNAVVKHVKIRWFSGSTYRGSLSGIEFLDKDMKSILKTGWWEASGEHTTQTVVLEEGERIVGYRSGRKGETYARHYDF